MLKAKTTIEVEHVQRTELSRISQQLPKVEESSERKNSEQPEEKFRKEEEELFGKELLVMLTGASNKQ